MPIQGTAADIVKIAMINIDVEMTREKMKSRMLIQVHDELVFEIPESRVESEAAMIREKMCGALSLEVPIVVDINWGRNWLEGE